MAWVVLVELPGQKEMTQSTSGRKNGFHSNREFELRESYPLVTMPTMLPSGQPRLPA